MVTTMREWEEDLMRFRARGRSRSACGCETGAGPAPPARTVEAAWTTRSQPAGSTDACFPEAALSPADVVLDTGAKVALSSAPVGCCGRIAAVSTPGAPALAHRLQDLGFVTGAIVEVVRRAPLGDPMLYRVCDYEICLRKAQAAAIQVHVLAPEHTSSAAPVAAASVTAA
jgi:ferrous iron transport protein A